MLSRQTVVFAGRLASMPRAEARKRVEAAGGQCRTGLAADTDLLVFGDGSAGKGRDELRGRAEAMARRTGRPRILEESEFLSLLGLDAGQQQGQLYGTARLARLLELEPARIRAWVRQSLLEPTRVVGRLCLFDFRAVARARTLARLAGRGLGPARIRRSLTQARRWLPEADAGPEHLEADSGARVMLRTPDGRPAEAHGQLLLDFDGGGPAPTHRLARVPDADTWFSRGVEAEAMGDLEGAATAYRRAIDLGESPEAHFNLGNCLWNLRRTEESSACYRRAVELDPDYAEAWNNLGNALAELGRCHEAVVAYRLALSTVPCYADAHYNLAGTLESLDRTAEAREHWRAFLSHDPNSPVAAEVRARLAVPEER